ncbi:MAG: hypothetical protein HY608_07960 [Planctomycetes bacterium]|nr:hypothetical protein [Planctomycetota bacterium]
MTSPADVFQHLDPTLQVLALLAVVAWLHRLGFGAGYTLFLLAVVLGFASGGDLETVADTLSRGTNAPETFLWVGVVWCLAGGAQMARLARRFRPVPIGCAKRSDLLSSRFAEAAPLGGKPPRFAPGPSLARVSGGIWGRAMGALLAHRTPPSFASGRRLHPPRFLSQAIATGLPIGAPFAIAAGLLDGRVPFRETCLVLGACGGLTAWCGLLVECAKRSDLLSSRFAEAAPLGGKPPPSAPGPSLAPVECAKRSDLLVGCAERSDLLSSRSAGRLLPQACAIVPVLALWPWGPPGLLAGALAGLIAAWISSGAGFGRGGRLLRRLPLADLALVVIGARVLLEALEAASLDGALLRPERPAASLAAGATLLPFLLGLILGEPNLALPLSLALLPLAGDSRNAALLAAACCTTAGTLAGGERGRGGLAAPLTLGAVGSALLAWRMVG